VLGIFVVALLTVSGCSAGTSDGEADIRTPDGSAFTTTFTRIAETGFIDMSLDFENPTDDPVTLVGRLVARDARGAMLPDVKVSTAFGTEAGRAIVMPGVNVDFAQLEGRGEQEVREITLENPEVSLVDVSRETEYVDLKPLDGDGRELEYDALAQQVSLENPSPAPTRVRVVLMVLRAPRQGIPQEAAFVRDVATVKADASSATVVDLDARTRRLLRNYGLTSFVTLRPVLAP